MKVEYEAPIVRRVLEAKVYAEDQHQVIKQFIFTSAEARQLANHASLQDPHDYRCGGTIMGIKFIVED